MNFTAAFALGSLVLFTSARADHPLLTQLNTEYAGVHQRLEDLRWQMAGGYRSHCDALLSAAETSMTGFRQLGDPILGDIRAALRERGLSRSDRAGLKAWKRFFETYRIPPKAAEAYELVLELETALESKMTRQEWSYLDPATNRRKKATSKEMQELVMVDPDEAVRRAAFEGLREIETWVLSNGLIELVKARNAYAKLLGYPNFYAYRVELLEGMDVETVYGKLDRLVQATGEEGAKTIADVVERHGPDAVEPWNFAYLTMGSIVGKMDPYFPFETALDVWGRSFTALGVGYQGGVLELDLIDRPGKRANGFLQAPEVSWFDGMGFHRGMVRFTTTGSVGVLGSGQSALKTLFHEGGHGLHFLGMMQPSAAAVQEYPPTSMAFAEVQSMFLDSFLSDPAWLARYPRTVDGESMPDDLIFEYLREKRKMAAYGVGSLLFVPYFEKALYELSDDELTTERVLAEARTAEKKALGTNGSPRPAVTVFHIINGEASASYQGYTLALMLVHQTREHFRRRYGQVVDDPRVGLDLAQIYWRDGNTKTLDEYASAMTGRGFSPMALVRSLTVSEADLEARIREGIAFGRSGVPFEGPVSLNGVIRLVHEDGEVMGTTENGGWEGLDRDWRAWIARLRAEAASD